MKSYLECSFEYLMFFPCLLHLLSFGLFHLHHWFLCVFYYTFLQTRKKLQCRRKQWEFVKFEHARNEGHWPCKGGRQCWNHTYLINGFWVFDLKSNSAIKCMNVCDYQCSSTIHVTIIMTPRLAWLPCQIWCYLTMLVWMWG